MTKTTSRLLVLLLLGAALAAGAALYGTGADTGKRGGPDRPPAPVEVSPVQRGPIDFRRTFSGTLEASAKFVVAPKVDGRIARLDVDLGDPVDQGQVVARLDDREHAQAVLEARAELAVVHATHQEAIQAFEITHREYERVQSLRKTGAVSESQLDAAKADRLAKQAELEVAAARVTKAEAALAAARIRRDYTEVAADWHTGTGRRYVAERFVDEGETVSENTPLLTIVDLDPITGVLLVTEKEYGRMAPGKPVSIETDAYPGRTFAGTVSRIAPVFRESTRQARVEVAVPNPEGTLKPGMFIRAEVVLDRREDAVLVPELAITRRSDRTGVFVLDDAGANVSWVEVEPGIRARGRVEIVSPPLSGRVVTLGQQYVADGSAVTVAAETDGRPAAGSAAP